MTLGNAWENTVDGGKFAVRVERLEPYRGRLVVEVAATGEVILDETLGLAYDAAFGPDVDDLSDWQDKTLTAIDAWEAANS